MYYLLLAFSIISTVSYSQDSKRSSLIKGFIENKKVYGKLGLDSTKGQVLVFLDWENKFGNTKINKWATIVHDTSLSRQLKRYLPSYVLSDSARHFLIRQFYFKKGYYFVDILHPYSGLCCRGWIRKHRGGYILRNLMSFVE
jgi:hypothetical protein